MKKNVVSLVFVAVMLLTGVQPANAQFFQGLAKLFGVKDDSPIMSLCQVGDQIGNAVAARKIDDVINEYGTAQVNSYEEWASDWNSAQNQKLSDFNSEKEQFMKDYCKRYGFYDLWVEEYGEGWFELAGRDWFEKQNNLRERRGEDLLLPYHLRGTAEEAVRYDPVPSSLSHAILNDIGLSSNDLETANRWVESDKYGKRDMVIDVTFDLLGKHSDNVEMLEGFRQLTKANNKYLRNKESKDPYAVTERNIDFANIVFNAAEVSKERKTRLLAEKQAICQDLMSNDVYANDPFALEIAGQVLAIQKDDSLTETEKKEWLCQLGYYGNVEEIMQAANKINNSVIEPVPVEPVGPTPEEIEAQIRKEQEEKERIEKEEAVATVNNTLVQKYEFDSTELTKEQKSQLDEIAVVMNKYNDLSLTITGHTCSKGYKSVNRRVGLRRANVAKTYLIEKGVEDSRISTSSMGEESPVVDNLPIENRQMNRRLEFVVK